MKRLSLVLTSMALAACVAEPMEEGSSSSFASSNMTIESSSAQQSSSVPVQSSSAMVQSSSQAPASSSSVSPDTGCKTIEEQGKILYESACSACHGDVQPNGKTSGGNGGVISPLDNTFGKSNFQLSLADYITQEMLAKASLFGPDCEDATCSEKVAIYLMNSAGADACPEVPIASSSSSVPIQVKPVVYSLVPGTTVEAPETVCGAVAVTPETSLTREQMKNLVADVFAPLTINNLDSHIAALPASGSAARLNQFTLESYLTFFDKVANQAVNRFSEMGLTCNQDSTNMRNCVNVWITERAKLAWGRTVTDAERTALLEGLFDPENNFGEGLRQVIRAVMLSGNVLYRWEEGINADNGSQVLNGRTKARKLSWLIWRSVPDAALIAAAESGALAKEAGFSEQVERMLADPKALRGFGSFHSDWLHMNGDVTEVSLAGIRELELMAEAAFKNRETFRDLFTTKRGFANSHLSRVYGLSGTQPAGLNFPSGFSLDGDQCDTTAHCKTTFGNTADDCSGSASAASICMCGGARCDANIEAGDPNIFEEVVLNDRPGILTRAALLAGTSTGTSSPTVRGEVISSSVLCTPIPEPDPEIQDMFATLPPLNGRSFRQLMEDLTVEPSCQGCHYNMDPYGFPLEHYDYEGKWRDAQENGAQLDVYVSASPLGVPIDGAIDLTNAVAESDDAVACYSEHWFEYAFDRHDEKDSCAIDDLKARFVESGGDLVQLIREIVDNPAFHYRKL